MKSPCSLLNSVKGSISAHGMLERGDRVVVAVSGGADSVCLLDVLARLVPDFGLELLVAHFEHGLREAEDGPETRFVEKLAREMSLPFELGTAGDLKKESGSLEERAREARYSFLEHVKTKCGAQKIALGHTLDDQAETVLMRLLRGSGTKGLSGIPPVRAPGIIRPLIGTPRKEVEGYLGSRGLKWITDSSNRDRNFLRNRIRLELLPELLRYQPRLVERLGALARDIREEDRFLDGLAAQWVEAHGEFPAGGVLVLPREETLGLDPALRLRVLRRALGWVAGGLRRIDRRHVEAVEGLARGQRPQSEISLPNRILARRSYDKLIFGSTHAKIGAPFELQLPSPGLYEIKEAGTCVHLQEKARRDIDLLNETPLKAFLDADKIHFPLTLRSILPGDRFIPLGMKGRRKIKDFLIDLKVPAEDRSRIPLLLSRGAVAWVCGYRIDERFKVGEGTERIFEASLIY